MANSGSTDGTLDIVQQIGGCRIIEREYVNSGNFKNWAIPQAVHSWVLIVDADERVTVPLAVEIASLLADMPRHDGYHIYRANYFLGTAFATAAGARIRCCDCSAAMRAATWARATTPRSLSHRAVPDGCGPGSSTSLIGPTTSIFKN